MYYDFFNLNEHPFRLTTDPRYLYLGSGHSQARAYLEYAIRNNDRLVILSGEIGSGKTLLIQDMINELDDSILAYKIHHTMLNNIEFLQMILREFGIKTFHNRKVEMIDQIQNFLIKQHQKGKHVILIIDEAQNLAPAVLEEVRLLLDFEYRGEKLMSLFLVGQPELNHIIDQPEMEQLRQRARLRYHIQALDLDDIEKYIIHRLSVAGEDHTVSISKDSYPLIEKYTGGRPRLINVLMDHALTCAFVDSQKEITPEYIQTSVDELNWLPYGEPIEDIQSAQETTLTDIGISKKIVVRKNGHWMADYPINKSRLNIGRHGDNDIVLGEPRISRQHAQIIVKGNEIFIQDMNSKNGTFTGSKRIDLHSMAAGDVITISKYELELVDSADETRDEITDSMNVVHFRQS